MLPAEVYEELHAQGDDVLSELLQEMAMGLVELKGIQNKDSEEYQVLLAKLTKTRNILTPMVLFGVQGIEVFYPKTLKWIGEQWMLVATR
jgi:hypothetical protein